MADEEVLDREAPEKPAGGKDKGSETITVSKAEWERNVRERDEARASEKYWAEHARGGNGNGKPPAEKEDPGIDVSDLVPKVTGDKDVDEAIFTDPDKWLEAIAKGPKAITALIRKQGFVNAEEVADIARKVARRTVDVERSKITTDNRLMAKFPELADNTSDLFKATAEEYRELLEFDPAGENDPRVLFAAAKAAKARLASARRRSSDDDEYGYDRPGEEERRTRIAAQDGSRGGVRRERADEEERIGPQARAVIEGMGLKQDQFLEAKKRVAGIGRSRR